MSFGECKEEDLSFAWYFRDVCFLRIAFLLLESVNLVFSLFLGAQQKKMYGFRIQ